MARVLDIARMGREWSNFNWFLRGTRALEGPAPTPVWLLWAASLA